MAEYYICRLSVHRTSSLDLRDLSYFSDLLFLAPVFLPNVVPSLLNVSKKKNKHVKLFM